MTHDSAGGYQPSSICSNCEIPIYIGTDHTTDDGCFVAMKQFVKLCQDDIENSRMRSFQHPTREELLNSMVYLEQEFEKFVIYINAMRERIRSSRMVH